MKMEKKRKKERKDTWILLNAAYEKKKEKEENEHFFLNRQYIDWKKRRNENWTFMNCDCNIVLTRCKVKLFEFVWV